MTPVLNLTFNNLSPHQHKTDLLISTTETGKLYEGECERISRRAQQSYLDNKNANVPANAITYLEVHSLSLYSLSCFDPSFSL